MNKVIILSGPTATGKTAKAIELAIRLKAEVVNFDSLLFYRELNIGTAKPSTEEMRSAPHHLINICSISDPINAADFARQAKIVIEDIHQRGHPVILVGGSGFYLQALISGMWGSPSTPAEIQTKSDDLYALQGIRPFREVLEKHDRESFHRLHENDHYRIRRAVEHFWTHGTAFSDVKVAFTPQAPTDWQLLHFYLDIPKEDHHQIIRARTKKMLSDGLVAEVQNLLTTGFNGTEKPLQAIGYKETLDWLNGVFGENVSEYEERIVINTRRLAKAQRTWFKKKEKIQLDPRHEGDTLMAKALAFISQG